MNLLESAAKAAGQVGTLYAENLIREDVLAKRDERLRAINKEDREARYAQEEKMFDRRADLNRELADTKWERDQLRSETDWQRKQGMVVDTFEGVDGVYGLTADGSVKKYSNLSDQVKAISTRESQQKALENVHELKLKLMGQKGSIPEEEFNTEWEKLEQLEREAYMTRGEVATKRQEAERQALKLEVAPRVKKAQEDGVARDKLISTYRNAGLEDAARMVEEMWPAGTNEPQESSPGWWSRILGGGDDSDQSAAGTSGTPQASGKPADAPDDPRGTKSMDAARGATDSEGTGEVGLLVSPDFYDAAKDQIQSTNKQLSERRAARLQSLRNQPGVKTAAPGNDQTTIKLKDIAKKSRKTVTQEQMDFINQHYDFIRTNLTAFDPKELKRFNVILDQMGAPKSKRFKVD